MSFFIWTESSGFSHTLDRISAHIGGAFYGTCRSTHGPGSYFFRGFTRDQAKRKNGNDR